MALFNVDEIYEMARQIERNGSAFYRKAAGKADTEAQTELFQQLAAMEDDHERTFAQMQAAAKTAAHTPPAYDPEDLAVRYLQAFVSGHVFDVTADPAEFLDIMPDMKAILKKAIQLEADSVLFYLGVKSMVEAGPAAHSIGDIIEQEMGHIAQLNEQLKGLP